MLGDASGTEPARVSTGGLSSPTSAPRLAAERGDEVTEEVTACTRCRVCAGQAAHPTSCQGGRAVSRPLCETRLRALHTFGQGETRRVPHGHQG